jgi:two-component system sensor histidine kinase BaeS
VLENLISNAIRHTQAQGQVTIRLREDAEKIAIDVEDSGCGIAAEDLPNIFDRYFRGPNASCARSDGAGLGLAIAKRIIELHGGEITVLSSLESGSVFRFYLPRIHVG